MDDTGSQMTLWPPYRARLEALAQLDARLAEVPDDLEAHFDRARMLTLLGRPEPARLAYFEILRRRPDHFGALNNLGALLYETGYRTAARRAYAEAVARHPGQPMGHVNLGNLLREAGELDAARAQYEAALGLAPDHPEAHQGLALLLLEHGEEEAALAHQRAGFRQGAVTVLPYRGAAEPVPVLLLISAARGNAPFQGLLDDRVFLVTVIVAEAFGEEEPLPPHRLVINAIGDADLCGAALRSAERIAARSPHPVINAPAAVRRTGRAENAVRLAAVPGLRTPATLTLPREALCGADAGAVLAQHGFTFPVLLRAPGFHTGLHFHLIAGLDGLAPAMAGMPGKALSLIQHLDARGSDGWFRKYRVMLVGGRLYPAHAAVSRNWKVHYFSADMADHPEHRAEDEAFLRDLPAVIGDRALRAVEGVRDALGLDYAGLDFGLDREGRVLLFEANAAMTIFPPGPGAIWDYRRAPVAAILDAARGLLQDQAGV
jgi:glutathione synthase/RimK-type ligase-like ATP-grasp enzyme